MFSPKQLIALLALLILAHGQSITIRNFGCKVYNSNATCIQCSTRYFLDSNTICQPVNPNCNAYSNITGACLSCYPGFGIIEDTCLPGVGSSFDPNCNTFNGKICTLCSKSYYLASTGKCTAVNPSCNAYDSTNGDCISCFAGFEVQKGNCVISLLQPTIVNCNSIDSKTGACVKCSFGYYFDANRLCVQKNPNCKTFDEAKSLCTECYSGHDLVNQDCVKGAAILIDQNCKTFNGSTCIECSKSAIFNPNHTCIVVDPSCFTFDRSNGSCTSCYPGYAVINNTCLLSKQTNASDPYCKTFLTSQICSQCSVRYFVGRSGRCEEINTLCKTYDNLTGNCLSCYDGFTLVSATCLAAVSNVTDQYCKTWNGSVCKECSFGAFFLANGSCAVANPLCKTFSKQNGNCLSCYDSFNLQGADCIKSNLTVSDPYCSEFYQGICLKCSTGYIFTDNGMCGAANQNCKQYNSMTGKCTSCYLGYQLVNGSCLNGTNKSNKSVIDSNCAQFKDGKCVTCSKNYYFGQAGLCQVVDPLCNGFNSTTGACLDCYQSYVLKNGSCIEDKNQSLSDPNCASWLKGVCISCATRTFMNSSGLCQAVDINCNTYNPDDGSCTSCFPGFSLAKGACQQSLSPSSCSKFNKDGSCALCGTGSYLSGGQCIAIDPQCPNFDVKSQVCLSCYPGYSILNGVCQISKVDSKYQVQNCYAYDQNNACIKCYDRYYLSSNSCFAVSVFCKTYDDNTGNCLGCYSSFSLKNGSCVN